MATFHSGRGQFQDETEGIGRLQLLEVLDFDPRAGVITFRDQRMLVQGAAAMGLLRRELIHTLGEKTARRLLLRFGYADGYHDAVSLNEAFSWPNPLDRVRAGLQLQVLEGIARAEPTRLEHEPSTGRFAAEVIWHNSYEAEQHLYHHGPSRDPACWALVGYISGFASACLGAEVYFRETACMGQGGARCALVGHDAAGWGSDLAAMRDDYQGADLRGEIERLRRTVLLQKRRLERRERALARREREVLFARRAEQHAVAKQFVVRSQAMRDVLEVALRVAPLDTTILITGESGTGKEFVARMIHEESPRAKGPLVSINCAALTDTLLEAELFGHERGAFTGAVRDRMGLFEQATGGTLLLDEVGEMSSALQVKLLRALQEREVRRVGGSRTIQVDARVVSATNRDLRTEAGAGRFRQDLYYRLAGFELRLPPLRERREEVPLLAFDFLRRVALRVGKDVRGISADAMTRLVNYDWPGNVRQLEHAIERAVILAPAANVRACDLAPEIREAVPIAPDERLTLKSHEARLIREALLRHRGHRRLAARALGISTVSLWRKMKQHGIMPDPAQG